MQREELATWMEELDQEQRWCGGATVGRKEEKEGEDEEEE
jgi:hypothetical protein